MKTVSQAFLDAQANNSITYYYEVWMYRRSWNGSAYAYELTPVDLKPYLKDGGIGNISWQLDTEDLNVWRVSNVQLELKNEHGEFNEGSGVFFNSTYGRFKTQVQIKIGYILPDGSNEIVYSFTGVVIDNCVISTDTNTIIMSLTGKEILATLASAETVCNTVIGETLGVGSLISTFYTSKNDVLSVSTVYKNGVQVMSGFTISNLYQTNFPAHVHFSTPPQPADVITADYVWGNNQVMTGEQIGTGAYNADFFTANKGVGFIDNVYIDGELLSVIDYSVGQLNDKDNYAKISFPVGVGLSQSVTCDYRHWYKDIAFNTLLGYIFDAAGFPSTDRTIDAIDVGSLLKYEIWDIKSDFDAMTLGKNIDTGSKVGSILVKNEDLVNDIASNVQVAITGTYPTQSASISSSWALSNTFDIMPTYPPWQWYELPTGGSGNTKEISPASNLHIVVANDAVNERREYLNDNSRSNIYSAECRVKLSISGATGAYFCFGGVPRNFINIYIGVKIKYIAGTWMATISDGYLAENWVSLGITDLAWADYHVFKFAYNPEISKITVWMDGAVLTSVTDSPSLITEFAIDVRKLAADSIGMTAWIDYVNYNDNAVPINEGIITSNIFNLGEGTPDLSKLGTILRTCTIPADGSQIVTQTQTSTSATFASGNDSWRTVSFVGNVATIDPATVSKRYARYRNILIYNVSTSPVLSFFSFPGYVLTQTIDCGNNLDVYNAFTLLSKLNNGAIKIYSQSSTNGTAWDAWLEIVAGVIASTKKEFIHFRIVPYYTATPTSPEISKFYFTYKITSLNVSMADFTGMTAQGAIEEFAKLLNYDIGVDTSGKYFFRAKDTGLIIDMELSGENYIISIDNDAIDWASIFNEVSVSIGNFNAIVSPKTLGTAEPTSFTKYGNRPLSIASQSVKIDDKLDLSDSLAQIYYNRYYLPKRQMRLKCQMLPQLELSDTLNINYKNVPWFWTWGDAKAYWGKPTIFWFARGMVPVDDLLSTIIGLELDFNDLQLYITIREI